MSDWKTMRDNDFLSYMQPHPLTGEDAPMMVSAGAMRRILKMMRDLPPRAVVLEPEKAERK